MKFIIKLLILISCGLFFSCANQVPPSGGPKDEDPPILISSKPDSFALNFNETSIELTFNETIQVSNIKNELIVTPTYTGSFDHKVKKNMVIIEFDTLFNDSTTYTINFREAIKDITEGNPAVNLRLAFSTWDFIDSLYINGRVTDLLTLFPSENYTVGMYDASDTITPLNGPPMYFTRTDEQGVYEMQNIKSGIYRIYTFNDLNNNLTIDSDTEQHGFLINQVVLDHSIDSLKLESQLLDFNELEVTSARRNGHYFEIKTSKYVTDHKIEIPGRDDTLFYNLLDKHKLFKIYNTIDIQDSLALYLQITDSLLTTVLDTIYISFGETKRAKDEFDFSATGTINKDQNTLKAELSFSKPTKTFTIDSMFIAWDSISFTPFSKEDLTFNTLKTKATLNLSLEEDPYYNSDTVSYKPEIMFTPAAFITIEEDSSGNLKSPITTVQLADFGIIKGKIDIPYTDYLVQLVDENMTVMDTLWNVSDYTFEYVPPGDYKLRVLVDENGDGSWYPGNLAENSKREPMIYFISEDGNSTLTLRPNWELVDMNIHTDMLNVN